MKLVLFIFFALMFFGSIITGVVVLIPKTNNTTSDTVLTGCILAFFISCIGLAKTELAVKINN